MRPDYLEAVAPQLGAGGFRRILDKGAFYPDCRHLASTFSYSSISTLATGAWPAQHGIVADSWYDRAAGQRVRASEEALLATTLLQQVEAESRMRSWVISMGQTDAALFAGPGSSRLYWMNDDGVFATRGDQPDWLDAYNMQRNPESARNQRWVAVGARPDAAPLRVLNYAPEHPREFLTLYKASPWGLAAQFDFLGELILRERLGQTNTTDVVCLSIGAMELLGYETGGRSPLMQQMVLHLDRRLEALLAQLNKAPGENAFNLVLAGAHGAPPEPAEESRARMAVNGESVAQTVERTLSATAMGRVEKYLYPFLYLDSSGFRDPEPIRAQAARAALQHPAVADYFTAAGAGSASDAWVRRFRNSFHHLRSGDVMLSYRAEYVEEFGARRGVSYGSLYNYDVRVPLCFYGPQFRSGVWEGPVESVDVAPTLARALGVAAPSSSVGRVLSEALVE
jgi:Type I phosphodiesterase / nucleotide pyrophosphatase